MSDPIQQLFDHALAEIKSTPQPTSSQLRDAAEKLFASVRAWKQSLPARPPREDYVRVTVEWQRFTYEPAIEWRSGDTFNHLTKRLERCANEAVDFHVAGQYRDRIPGYVTPPDSMSIAQVIGKAIADEWPDRAYFVEVWQNGTEGFAQVFQPYGVPRNQ